MQLWGSIPALVTPFRDGAVDEEALVRLVEWQIEEGSHGLVPCGTTGEAPTLSESEHAQVIRIVIEASGGRVPVIPGTGSNSTEHSIHLSRSAQSLGADAVLVVAPYYNKPTQEGLYQHFRAVHDAIDIPVVIYNIPGRSVADISPETMARLAALPRMLAVKDATADLSRPLRMRQLVGNDFLQLSGEDPTAVAFLAQGGVGCISVTANVAPGASARLQAAWRAKDWAEVERLRDWLQPLNRALFLETSPAPTKYALSLLGRCDNSLRLPMVPVSAATQAEIRQVLERMDLL